MSRRPNPDRAAQNQQTIKSLLKLTCNKTCADCKRNKHPRWASWNLGIFICIRCSGIHRGMGTHISRVKSVDLDSWTDEQLQSVLRWGNARANKYWEAKLVPGHVPSEAKIENFIRTKYESKRWVMDGPMPDPSTLGVEGDDDDVPLAVVQEKAKLERSSSQRASSVAAQPPARSQQPAINLFDDDPPAPPVRPNTTDVSGTRAQPRAAQPAPAAPQKQAKPADSLLGLDFFGPPPTAPTNRPSSTVSNTSSTGPSRPDLKQSILSLYAKPQQSPQHDRNTSFGSMSAMQSPQTRTSNDAFSGLTDAFSGLKFPATTAPSAPAPKKSSFSAFDTLTSPKSPPAQPQLTSPSSALSGGGFFDSGPSKPAPKPQQTRNTSISSGNNFDLIGATMGSVKSPAAPPSSSTSAFDLLSSPPMAAPQAPAPAQAPAPQQSNVNSIFNLSSPPPPKSAAASPPVSTANVASLLSTSALDPWGGGGNAWGAPESAPAQPPKQTSSMMKVPDTLTANDIGNGWGAPAPSNKPAPAVSEDEDFGGWASAMPNTTTTTIQSNTQPKAGGGFAGGDDLFGNVWQ